MIYIKVNGENKWKVNSFTFTDKEMDKKTITLQINHLTDWLDKETIGEVPSFTHAYVEFEGDRYDIVSTKPTGEKDTSSISYKYTLTFEAYLDLRKRKVRDLAQAGLEKFVSYGTTFSLYANIEMFIQLLRTNLNYYFDDKWNIVYMGSSTDEVMVTVDNAYIWDLLLKTYEYFELRWVIRGNTIYIGEAPEHIDHIFEYGKEGGLTKITRTAKKDPVANRLAGVGGTRNVPVNYFSNRHPEFPQDPNPISPDVRIRNVMPKVFRDSVKNNLPQLIDYVEDSALIAEYGVAEDALQPNEAIYPSIAGVEVTGLGRIDEIVAIEADNLDNPEDEGFSQIFHIWVKDIGFDLSDSQYTSTEEAKISFTSGMLAGYDFTILAEGETRVVVEDTSKTHNGVQSKYKITLIKSDEDYDISNRLIPNSVLKGQAGDKFIIYDIEMPQVYVEYAEQRVQDWLEASLSKVKVEKPTYLIEPYDSFFTANPDVLPQIKAGNIVSILDDNLTGDILDLHLNSVTVEYGGLLPKYSFVVTDSIDAGGSAVARLQTNIDAIASRQYFTSMELQDLLKGVSKDFISKKKDDYTNGFITFMKGLKSLGKITAEDGIQIGESFAGGIHTGQGGLIDSAGNAELESLVLRSFLEVPSIRYNELEYIGEEIIIGAGAVLKDVEHLGDARYRLTLKLEEGQLNPFRPSDLLKGIYNMDEDGNFTGFGTTYVSVSSIDEHEMIVILADESDVVGNRNMPPRKFMHIARIGSFTDTDRQSYISLSAKDRAITQYGGVNAFARKNKQGKNVRAGVVTTQWGRAEGLEFIENFDNLPITKDSDVLYTDTLLYNKMIKVDYQGIVIKEYIDRGQWFEGMECQVTETTIDEVWHEAEKFRLMDRPIENDPFVTTEKPTRESEDWMLILSLKEEMDKSRGSVTFFAKPTKYKKGDRWVLIEDTQLLGNFYKKGQALEAVYATGNDSDWRLLVFADETDGINLIRNYTYKERTLIVEGETKIIIPHWENAPKEAFVMLDDEIPTEYYNTSINVIGDEYGANYIITSEDDEAIQFDK